MYEKLRGLMDVPENIVMLGETAIPDACGWERHVLSERLHALARIPAGMVDQRHMTLLAACTAAGSMLPPCYIFSGQYLMAVSLACRAARAACRVRPDVRPRVVSLSPPRVCADLGD